MEIKPNKTYKLNTPLFGIAVGVVLPIISFLIYFLYTYLRTDVQLISFLDTLYVTKTFTPVISLCVLPNLIAYFIFKKLDYWYSIKGIVASVLMYTILVLILKFS